MRFVRYIDKGDILYFPKWKSIRQNGHISWFVVISYIELKILRSVIYHILVLQLDKNHYRDFSSY